LINGLSGAIKELARQAGFDLVGITHARPLPEAFDRWDAAQMHGRLAALPWLSAKRARLACDPQSLLPTARSALCVGMGYLTGANEPSLSSVSINLLSFRGSAATEESAPPGGKDSLDRDAGLRNPRTPIAPGGGNDYGSPIPISQGAGITGRVARYARGIDYHRTVRQRLRQVHRQAEALVGRPIEARICVDSAPLAEKPLAEMAGLGWMGKHTLLISPSIGSWFVLGEVVWDLDLAPDPPAGDGCGDCDRCLRACPTGALVAPYHLDIGRCLSYLTVENRGALRDGINLHSWLYGCDACQEACPHNQAAPAPNHAEWRIGLGDRLLLVKVLTMSKSEWDGGFGETGLRRAGLAGIQRNAKWILEARG
jgi:epoxyqueuosine reductase